MDFIQSIEKACSKEAVKNYVPMQPGDVYQTDADTTLLQHDMLYKPNKDIIDGTQETVEWYRSFYNI